MCKVCRKIEFFIETMERFHTLEEWRVLLLSMDMSEDAAEVIREDDLNVWANLITMITATWLRKKQIPFDVAMNTLAIHMIQEYFYKDHILHKEMEDYES
jgi:hypothetical protein